MAAICVIVPVYNTEKYLHRCVESILAQSFHDFELILVDDGSTDSSGTICDTYAKKDERVIVFHQKNQGQAAARNFALDWIFENSSSKFISFVDSDDWIHPQYLEALYNAILDTKASASACLYTRTLLGGEELDNFSFAEKTAVLTYDQYFSITGWGFTPYIPCAKLFPRKCFSQLRFPVGKINEDLFATHQFLFPCQTIARVNTVLYYYFQSDNSTMRKEWTPKRMDEIEASELLISFMHKNGFAQSEKTAIYRYLWVIKDHISQIDHSRSDTYSDYRRKLVRKMRKLLLRYRTDYFPFSKYRDTYEAAFPHLSRVYHLGGKLLGRHR